MTLTVDSHLRAADVGPRAIELWHAGLEAAAQRFEINTDERLVAWLATCVHESARFTRLVENLNYGAAALLQYFPRTAKRPWGFTPTEARDYERHPERIANRIYANRMGNGPESSGDGWRYRGMGPIQLTGFDNRAACMAVLGIDLLNDEFALMQPGTGSLAAAWFWQNAGCNQLADAGRLRDIRKAVNGGLIGLDEFVACVERIGQATRMEADDE